MLCVHFVISQGFSYFHSKRQRRRSVLLLQLLSVQPQRYTPWPGMYGHTYSKRRIDRVRLPILHMVSSTGKMNIFLSAFAHENLVSRDGIGSLVPRQPAHLHAQAEPGSYIRDSSRVLRQRPLLYFKPPYAIGSVPSLSGHAIACRWRSRPRVRRHRASKPYGSSERVLPCQVTTDQLICASLSITHYWYEMGMLKLPANITL